VATIVRGITVMRDDEIVTHGQGKPVRFGETLDDVAGFIDLTGRNIENLFVDPAVQGRGLGSVLMAAAEEALGAGDLTLAVFTVNPDARRLYERLGFVVESIGAATLSGGEAEVWRMRKRRG
jgi:ribosomal protein S18 acetylase RimI-like enzyme